MQWKKLTRLKAATGHSRARRMLCCGRRKENGRSVPDVTASPGRAPPGPLPNQMQHMSNQRQPSTGGVKEPILQGDFRKVSGISSDVFRQIEAVENDHDPNTAAALEAVERRGEMIVRILEARNIGGKHAVEAAQRLLTKGDARHTVQLVEIVKRPGQTLGLYIREGNGADRTDGVFISRIALESAVYNSGCLRVGDEILAVNLVDVTHMSLDDVVIIMSIPRRLVLAIRQRRGNRGGASSPGAAQLSRPEQKPPPVVVIKRDLRDEDLDEPDRLPRSRSSRERRTGDGREMTESRSRLGLGLNNYSPQSEQLDLYYNSRPSNVINEPPSWGYKPPPPPPSVITEQPKGHHFAPSHAYYQNAGTLESLAEKVHSFYPGGPGRRMSAGTGPTAGVTINQAHARFPRSGSDQHLPRVEYSDYATSLGRHSLLRSSLKTGAPIATAGGTLGRYGRYEPSRTAKYGTPPSGPSSLTRRSRPNLDYSSDTEATIGQPRPSYYYYNRPAIASAIPSRAGAASVLGGGPDLAKFNSLPRDRPGVRLGGIRPRIGDRLLDETDGNLSAPESSLRRERDLLRAKITASPSIFTSDEYRAWLRRAPSSSAICDQMRMSRDLLAQPRSYRFSCSAENIHDALRNTESIYSSRTGVMAGTLDRHMGAAGLAGAPRAGLSALPVRSMSSQHIGTASSIRSPSIRRMRQLLELSTGGPGVVGPNSPSGSIISAGHQSPAPTPSATLPRSHRQIDINPAEFVKYKLDKPVMEVGGISGMLWIHLLAGRGLRSQPEVPPGNPLQPQQPLTRDLYCVLECDRVHKARTVVRSGDLQFDWDESFELDLVCNKQLDVLVYSWDPQHRHKLCYRGAISLASILRQSPLHQLALKVEPRGTIYIRLRHTDPITLYKRRGLPSLRAGYPQLFGADLETVVNRESKGAPGSAPVPIVLRRCVEEVERRGLDIIGLYRLCGSATKKRLLREAFERNSRAVELSPEHVPDINVITGVLKDYLRELPEPLFTRCLFQMTVDALAVCLPDDPEGNAKLMLSILDCLPRANRATLVFLLDHLSLVVSASERNKMSAQALATVMGPPLMLHSSNAQPGSDIDHAQPIAVLKYLLQIWPQPQSVTSTASGRRGEPTGQRGNKVSASQVDRQLLQQRQLQHIMGMGLQQQAANMVLSQGQHHPLATVSTANIPQFQSVAAQSVQLHRVSQQVAQQHLQSEASAGSVTQDQSLLPGTPSPGSSSTSGSGSGSGTDTVKRGASPSSVKHVKIHESSSSLSISNSNSSTATVKLSQYNNHQQQQQQQQQNEQMQQNDFTSTSSNLYTNSSNKINKDNKDISNNDKNRFMKNLKESNNGVISSSTNSYGPSYTKSLSGYDIDKDNGSTIINNSITTISSNASISPLASASVKSSSVLTSSSISSSTSSISSNIARIQQKIRSRSRTRFEDSDSDSESRCRTPNPLLEQSQAMTTTQLMSKYLKREPLVSMTLTESPCPPIMSSLSSSIRDICAASQSATSKYDKPTSQSLGEAEDPTSNLFNTIKTHLSSSSSYIFPSGNMKSSSAPSTTTTATGGTSAFSGSTISTAIDDYEKKNIIHKQSSSTTDTTGRQTSSSPIRSELHDSNVVTSSANSSSVVARNVSLFQTKTQSSSSTDSSASISSASDSNNYLTNNKNLIIDEKQFNNFNNYPVSPDPFNTSFINFDKLGSSASLSQSAYGAGITGNGSGIGSTNGTGILGSGNGSSGNGHYNIYGTLPKTISSAAMLSSTSSYLSSGGGSSDTTSGVSSMAGSTTSYDYYMNSSRQYSLGSTSLNGSGGNYHTLGSYRVQYTATNPFLDIFEPGNGNNGNHGNGNGNGSKRSSSTALNSVRDQYSTENDLK